MRLSISSQSQTVTSTPAGKALHKGKRHEKILDGLERLYVSGKKDGVSIRRVNEAALYKRDISLLAKDIPKQLNKNTPTADKIEMQPIKVIKPVSEESSPSTKELIALFEKGYQSKNQAKPVVHTGNTNHAELPVTGVSVRSLRSKFEKLSSDNTQPLVKQPKTKTTAKMAEGAPSSPSVEKTVIENKAPLSGSVENLLKRSEETSINPFALLLEDFENELNATKSANKNILKHSDKAENKIDTISKQEPEEQETAEAYSPQELIQTIANNQNKNKPSAEALKALEASLDSNQPPSKSLHEIYNSNAKEINKCLSFNERIDSLNPDLKKHLDKIKAYDKKDNQDGMIRHQIKMLKVIYAMEKSKDLKDLIKLLQEGASLLDSQDEKDEFISDQSELITLHSKQIEQKKSTYASKIKELMAENKVIYEQTKRAELEALQQSKISHYATEPGDDTPVSAEELAAHRRSCEKMLQEIDRKDQRVSEAMALHWQTLETKIEKNRQTSAN